MSTIQTTAYVEQWRLPRQVAAPEGPVDVKMMYVMHHAFRRDLVMFAEAAAVTPADDRETWGALSRRWQVFSEILHHHHSGEDAGLWPWLLEVVDAGERATLEAMEAEHAEIDPLLSACTEGLARLADHADEDARAALAVRLVATRDSLSRHLAHEERDAIAILQRLMTQEEWLALDEEHFKRTMSPRQIAALVPWAAYGVPRAELGRIFAEAGIGFRLVWLATRRRFANREARTFRYA